MVAAIAALLICQLIGEAAARLLAMPVPGPVLGLALLFACLWLRGRRPDAPAVADTKLGVVARGLLANMSLLFVPAGVGIYRYGGALAAHAPAVIAALVGSTALTLVVAALLFRAVAAPEPGATKDRR